jgi:anthranilate synthase component 1
MKKIKVHTAVQKSLADTFTPVNIYLKLRDKYPNSLLLESSDYHGGQNSFSYICCDPVATIRVENEVITELFPGERIETKIGEGISVPDRIQQFIDRFDTGASVAGPVPSGLFGYTAYDAVRYFEEVKINTVNRADKCIPDLQYSLYRFVIAIDHFRDEMHIAENTLDGDSKMQEILSFVNRHGIPNYRFARKGKETSNLTDKNYTDMVKRGKAECKRGNIFQVVLSREFVQDFTGDEFNVYRALRTVNPSPYLFYFDYGNFRIFGSSPEAQLVIRNGKAEVHPIAGTVKRSGNEDEDAKATEVLRNDSKENSEHVMLVDLARNDLSRNCNEVQVEVFAETQYYSHVIHLVSRVTGKLKKGRSGIRAFAATFPAGTLSGAPKPKAMQIIDECENDRRGYYGGGIGFIGFNGDINQAIIIRSFLSKNNTLYCRAGAGVVIASKEENELQEVNNKLGALKRSIELAEGL